MNRFLEPPRRFGYVRLSRGRQKFFQLNMDEDTVNTIVAIISHRGEDEIFFVKPSFQYPVWTFRRWITYAILDPRHFHRLSTVLHTYAN